MDIDSVKQTIIHNIRLAMSRDCDKGLTTTRILNADYSLAQFHTLMDLLFDIDIDSYVSLADEYKDRRTELLNLAEQLYG